jgi:Secretion system C-terminal sorting domain
LPLGFGNNPVEGGQYFIGALDNVKIYNKSLTAAEILQLFQTGTTASKDLSNALQGLVLSVSPNPTTDVITIQHAFDGAQPLLVRVFDVAGRQVDDLRFAKNALPAGQFSLNVNNYQTGFYTINFVLDGKNLGSVQFNKQ